MEQACEMLKFLKISDFSLFESTYQNLEVNFMEDGATRESIFGYENSLCIRINQN